MKARLFAAVSRVFEDNHRLIEKHLFGFLLADTVLLVLPGITFIPLEALNGIEVHHRCIQP